MYEDAQEIFNYLPIRRDTSEDEYLKHLWSSFTLLEKAERLWEKDANGFAVDDASLKMARPFSVMPYHLLFMMSVQYKMLQIALAHKTATDLFFTVVGGRNKAQLLSPKRSVFDMALINERTIPDIFQLVSLNPDVIKKCKDLVDHRNDTLAHAKGGIEQDVETKILEYGSVLDAVQKCCLPINQKWANNWLLEIKAGDDIAQFMEIHFLDSRFSPRDFGDIIGTLLEAENLDFEQWEQVVEKGFDLAHSQTIEALKLISQSELDEGRRFNAIRVLHENGGIDEEMRKSMIEKETDAEILELLKKQ